MKEISLKKILKKIVIFSICITIFLVIAGWAIVNIYFSVLDNATEEHMYEEVDFYKERIEKQVERNFEMMRSMAGIIGEAGLETEEDFYSILRAADSQNDFLILGYFDLEGHGTISTAEEEEDSQILLENMPEAVRKNIQTTMQGEEVISDTLISRVSGKPAFVFSVPVYAKGEIVGALFASDSVDAFSDELGVQNIFHGSGRMHLVNSEGEFMIRSEKAVVKEERLSVLEPPYMSAEEVRTVKNALEKMETVSFTFTYENVKYNALLKPVDINGWYLFCVNSLKNVNKNIYGLGYVTIGFFTVTVLLFFFVLVYGYKIVKRINWQLRIVAYYDQLTDIYNIGHFRDLVEEEVKKDGQYTIVVLNICQFKFINEIFGKEQADRLLQFIGKRLNSVVNVDEYVCRERADFFYLFLRETEEWQIRKRIQRLNESIVDGDGMQYSKYRIQMRYGIAIAAQEETLQEVMNHAMFALSRTKKNKEYIWFFDRELHEQEVLDNYIESHAQEALDNQEFELYLQPKKNLVDNSLAGAEALVRWRQSDGSVLFPGAFISLFEGNGFCAELDMYMFERVCCQLRLWIDAGYEPVPISINQSKITFYEENYEEKLCECLKRYEIDASWITLEILESMALENVEELNRRLEKLQKIGFRISLDDFGTGYSSLNVLGRLRINEVKLDRGFLMDVAGNVSSNMCVVMEEVIQLSRKLSISTVVEGIETEQNERLVRKLGGDIGQGYLYSKPVSAEVFTEEILKNR